MRLSFLPAWGALAALLFSFSAHAAAVCPVVQSTPGTVPDYATLLGAERSDQVALQGGCGNFDTLYIGGVQLQAGAGFGNMVASGSFTANDIPKVTDTAGHAVVTSGISAANVATLSGAQTVSGIKTFTAPPVLPTYTIGALPTCGSAAAAGSVAYVTNGQTSPTYLGAVSSTGAVVAPVFCNGSGWVYH